MSFGHEVWSMNLRGFSAEEKVLLQALAGRTNQDDMAVTSIEALADSAELPVERVEELMRKLRGDGVILWPMPAHFLQEEGEITIHMTGAVAAGYSYAEEANEQ